MTVDKSTESVEERFGRLSVVSYMLNRKELLHPVGEYYFMACFVVALSEG